MADSEVIELSEAELRYAIQATLNRIGCTYAELKEQARTGNYTSSAARMAWVGIGGLAEYV